MVTFMKLDNQWVLKGPKDLLEVDKVATVDLKTGSTKKVLVDPVIREYNNLANLYEGEVPGVYRWCYIGINPKAIPENK